MGGHINYQGRVVAYYNICLRGKEPSDPTKIDKYNIKFFSLKDMESLLRAEPDDPVLIGSKEMSYKEFREDVLKRSNRIYVSSDTEVMDSGYEFVEGVIKKGSMDKWVRDKEAHEGLDKILDNPSFSEGDLQIQVKKI